MKPASSLSLVRSSRRDFLRQASLGLAACAATGMAPRLLGRSRPGAREPRTLVLIQLAGGNDWLNTFVPADDADYRRLRPTLALAASARLRLTEQLGLNRAARGFERLFKDGQLALVSGLGPEPDVATHHRASELWHTASAGDEILATGWAGRALADLSRPGAPVAAWHGTRLAPRVLAADGFAAQPLAAAGAGLATQLAEIGERAGTAAVNEVYFVSAPGFDTHFDQATLQSGQLAEVADGLALLQARLSARGVARRVVTCVFSEFGRSRQENHQGGTEHARLGTALLLGPAVRGGEFPTAGADLRRLALTLGAGWLGAAPAAVVPAPFAPLPVLAAG